MPTPSTAKWAKPKSADEFEDIVVDALRIRWQDPNAHRNGRNGQEQHGVDVIGHPPWLDGGTAGGQCKNTETLTLTQVIAEVDDARSFVGGLDEYYIVTSADRDGRLQASVRQHFATTPAPFAVHLIFWQDVVADISGDDDLVAKHWKFGSASTTELRKQIALIRSEAQRMYKHADALNRGFFGDFWQDHIRDKFRPETMERAIPHVATDVAKHEVLQTNLDWLRNSVAAADAETDRLLDPRNRIWNLDALQQLVLRVLNNTVQLTRSIDQVYGPLT